MKSTDKRIEKSWPITRATQPRGGMSLEYVNDSEAQQNFTALKALLDEANVEDRGCTEKVYRGLCSNLAVPGPLSHLERPNNEFARYLASRIRPSGG